jgi:hypothetical protein
VAEPPVQFVALGPVPEHADEAAVVDVGDSVLADELRAVEAEESRVARPGPVLLDGGQDLLLDRFRALIGVDGVPRPAHEVVLLGAKGLRVGLVDVREPARLVEETDPVPGRRHGPAVAVPLSRSAARLDGVDHPVREDLVLVGARGLLEVVRDPGCDGLARHLLAPLAGVEDEGEVRIGRADALEQRQAVEAGHVEVGHDRGTSPGSPRRGGTLLTRSSDPSHMASDPDRRWIARQPLQSPGFGFFFGA